MSSIRPAARFDSVGLSLIRQINDLGTPDCVNLGLGEPNLEPDETLRALMDRAAREFPLGYSAVPGTLELRERIGSMYEMDPDQVCVTTGSEEALYAVLQGFVGPGDEVLLPDPGFAVYSSMVSLAGGTPVAYPLQPPEWGIDLDRFESLVNPATKAILLNSPSNPTGGILDQTQIRQVIEIAEKHGALVVSDEVYREIYYDEKPASAAGISENVVILSSLSKSHGLTGLRLGWMAASRELMATLRKAHHYMTICASTYSQKLAELILAEESWNEKWLEKARTQFAGQRDAAIDALREHVGPVDSVDTGAFYIFQPVPTCRTLEFAKNLATESKLLMIPGSAFGEVGEGFLRISYASSEEKIREGIRRLGEALERAES